MRRKLILVAILIVALIVFSVLGHQASQRFGHATIVLGVPNTQSLTVTVNSQRMPVSGLSNTYKLTNGQQRLKVTKPGYKPFSTTFTMGTGQNLVINVTMQSNAPKVAQSANQQVNSTFQFTANGASTLQTTYFYNNTWVVAQISSPDGVTGIVIGKYVGGSTPWQTVLGPGTLFENSDLNGLPSDVSNYMIQQHYALGGS